MIEVISSWAKSLGVTIVLVSILEMILPNNKTKKYIRMVLGIFVIFNIISPFIQNKDKLSLASINIEDYYLEGSSNIAENNNGNINNKDTNTLNQTSMDQRIKELYQDELEKDITKKVEEQGYKISSCRVQAEVPTKENQEENETGIIKIELRIKEKIENESNDDATSENSNNNQEQKESIENKIVTGVQRIKEVDVSGDGAKKQQDENEKNDAEDKTNSKVTRSDIQNIKKFLIEEYGVSEKCLEIN